MPDPQNPAYTEAVIDRAIRAHPGVAGRGVRAVHEPSRAGEAPRSCCERSGQKRSPYNLYVQGEAPRERLLKEFREDGYGVLLGTTSFWEGVDVKGEAPRLVIIEKLPFASPDDPITKARIDHLQATGGNAFRDYQLPEAALALKQGVGRLIRSEEDYGAVVICDPRIVGRNYGRVFVASLPPAMPVTRESDEALRFLRRHSPDPGSASTRVRRTMSCAHRHLAAHGAHRLASQDPGAGYRDRELLGRAPRRRQAHVARGGVRSRPRRSTSCR